MIQLWCDPLEKVFWIFDTKSDCRSKIDEDISIVLSTMTDDFYDYDYGQLKLLPNDYMITEANSLEELKYKVPWLFL